MKLTKKKEERLRNSAKFVRETLQQMTNGQSEEFVLNQADGKTLTQLSALQRTINGWGFRRSF